MPSEHLGPACSLQKQRHSRFQLEKNSDCPLYFGGTLSSLFPLHMPPAQTLDELTFYFRFLKHFCFSEWQTAVTAKCSSQWVGHLSTSTHPGICDSGALAG